MLERDYAALPAEKKRRVIDEVELLGETVRFEGFDGNNETAHMSTALDIKSVLRSAMTAAHKRRGNTYVTART